MPCSRSRRARATTSSRSSFASARPSRIRAAIGGELRRPGNAALEAVRWTVTLGAAFDEARFSRALARFRELYNVAPLRVLCAPDVLARFAELHARSGDDAFARELRHEGLPVTAAVLAPGTAVFEGEVDDVRMGDW